jgi:hypothetical protein
MSKRKHIQKAAEQAKNFIQEKALNWTAAGLVETDPLTEAEQEELLRQQQMAEEKPEQQEEPIYINADSHDGLHLKAKLNVLLSYEKNLAEAAYLRGKLSSGGLTKTQHDRAYSILKGFGY